ncbi:universal stress protein [Haloflavibacter putidus]|uniref:Universal stress protein n=1 Tax=Haloflavibacter putidus TaxID=2576776 RepID=A0A507ZSA3_9FLAO|nr:universal stress protein [Haloflavibacter putidus]TQD40249.1 universal stress protein [Haloflavibacter putidus]
MQRVLIAIDYHPSSEKVAEAGYELAKKMNAEVCLLHVFTETKYYGVEFPTFLGYDSYNVALNMEMQSEIKKVAENYVEEAAKHLGKNIQTQLKVGETAEEILKYSKEWKADLVVMGTHSRSTLEKLFMGTEATKVLENTTIPVFMVPVKK